LGKWVGREEPPKICMKDTTKHVEVDIVQVETWVPLTQTSAST
jgi:hypothetical protein